MKAAPVFIRRLLPLVVLVTTGACTLSLAQPTQTHGQAAGDPRPDGASVWTRTSADALVSVRYATDPLLSGFVESAAVTVDGTTDHTVRIDLSGLSANTVWYYRFVIRDLNNPTLQSVGPLGRFKTAPPPGVSSEVTVAFGADINGPSPTGLFSTVATQAPDLLLLLGDFPYADSSPAATTLAEYRQKHRNVRVDGPLQSLLSSTAIAPIWDDHEVSNDWNSATDPAKVALGRTVWKEYMPVPLTGDAVYRTIPMGRGAEFFILDTRTYRGSNAAPDLPGRTLLGAQQLAWLKSSLASSNAVFKVVVSSVPLRYGTTNKDHWQGYMREREDLLTWISQNRISNVVFLSGDQHWSAIHHHREGIKEFQGCPFAASLRPPPLQPEPEVRSIFPVYSFGIVRIRPNVVPEELVIELRDASGVLESTTLLAGAPAKLDISLDAPDAGFVLDGPHRFQNGGERTAFPYAPAGRYGLSVSSPRGFLAVPPSPSGFLVPPDGFLSAAVSTGYLDDPSHPTLFHADFNDPDLSAWTAIDEGNVDGPSAWFQDDYGLVQSSNIYGGATAATAPDKPGTLFVAGNSAWTDVTLTFRVRSDDDDGIGAAFRVAPDGSHYRFAMDSQRNFRRLTRTLAGVTTILAEVSGGYVSDRWYNVTIKALGPQLTVALDGQPILSATDSAIPSGRVALYCWGSQVVWFDDVTVRQGDVSLAPTGALFVDDFSAPGLPGWTVIDQGTVSAPSAWSALLGEAVQSSNIYGGSLTGSIPDKPGTFLLTGDPNWTNTVTTARLRNDDNDAFGIMVRVIDASNYYRFSMDSERAYRRLTRTQNGVTTILAEDNVSFVPGIGYDVEVTADGPSLQVRVDGVPILSAIDSTFSSGRIALYSWGSTGARFDDVVVTPVTSSSPDPVALVAHGSATDFDLDILASEWPNRAYALALSFGTSPGIPLSSANPADPRIVPLNPDALFALSLQPSPYLSAFTGVLDGQGRGIATLTLPPGLSGLYFYAAGVLLDGAEPSGVAIVLPPVPIELP